MNASKSPSGLFTLCYVSRRAPGVSDAEVVDGIVLPAMSKNRRLDITGCLWFDSERFVQVLEGPSGDVLALYTSIAGDRRHTDIELLQQGPIERRNFERFSMRTMGPERPASVAALLRLCDGLGAKTARLGEELVRVVASVSRELATWPVAV